jgi:GDP-L-fucose synthase
MDITLPKQKVSNLSKLRIFLTGSRGMVGQNILEHPLSVNYDILAPTSTELDLRDATATQQFINRTKPDIVVHAAGRVGGIQANILNPIDFLVANIDMGRNVIMSAYKARVPYLLNLASSCMYPRNANNPLSENLILKGELEPTNEGYALAKIFASRLCEYINRENVKNGRSTIRYKTLIPCNLYGRYDKFEPEHSHLIPAIIHKIHLAKLKGLAEVEIWGDGTARREFMYAGDLADAIMKSLNEYNQIPDLMNIGHGYDHSINDYYQIVAEVIGWNGKFVYDTTKPVGMKQKLVDITRQSKWGWKPSTSLEPGIRKIYNFYLEVACK